MIQIHKNTAFDILERFDGWAIDYGIGREGAIAMRSLSNSKTQIMLHSRRNLQVLCSFYVISSQL
ncbi:hypothetical protein LC653_09015 [Nostoc sp. CHAB 5784]|uniref:hypothetical protein n=1 Tax=Nostoc mirabile TaxID=2907820 RepID=UPI001E4CCED9|nr:hypothetical protein [Nostoc mirabile]MCC5664056.1 hypothetical protein [Nostoc mirabile CHAB5784]